MSATCILLGFARLNASMTPSTSIWISLWIWSRLKPVSLSVVIVERKGVFVLLSKLNDLSAEHVVTGRVERIFRGTVMFG